MAKTSLYEGVAESDLIAQMKREEACQAVLLNTEDFREAAVAFMEKRDPVFKGR